MRKHLLPIGILAGIVGVTLSSMAAIVLAAVLLSWYAMTELRIDMLASHQAAMSDESVHLGDRTVPLAQCALGKAEYGLAHVIPPIPCVRQSVTWRDVETGTISQFLAKTNIWKTTTIHPLAVFSAGS